MLKRWMWVGFAATCCAGLIEAAGSPAPRLVCDEPAFDFGTRNNTSPVEHTFLVKNAGNAPLIIEKVRTGCGCTKAEMSTNVVPAGGTASLVTVLSLRGITGLKRTGIYIHSNDPEHPIYAFQCSGTAKEEISIVPRQVSFGYRLGDTPPEQRVSIVNASALPLHIQEIESPALFLAPQVETNEAGKAYTLTLRVSSNGVPTRAVEFIRLLTDHPLYPRLEIPVYLSVARELTVMPTELVLHADAGAPPQTRYIVVRSVQQRDFKVLGVEATRQDIPTAIQNSKPTWAKIRVGPLNPSAAMNGSTIRVRTDFPRYETLEIPIRVISKNTSG